MDPIIKHKSLATHIEIRLGREDSDRDTEDLVRRCRRWPGRSGRPRCPVVGRIGGDSRTTWTEAAVDLVGPGPRTSPSAAGDADIRDGGCTTTVVERKMCVSILSWTMEATCRSKEERVAPTGGYSRRREGGR